MPEEATEVSVDIEVEQEAPEGSHRMPDGRIMKDSEEHTEEDLEQLMMARMA